MVDAAKRLFDDLLSIEVNTLVKAGMTGRKMPAPAHAMIDVLNQYDSWLATNTRKIDAAWKTFCAGAAATDFLDEVAEEQAFDNWWLFEGTPPTLIPGLAIRSPLRAGDTLDASSFRELGQSARQAIDMHRVLTARVEDFGGELDVMLQRIARNCDQLMAILERHASVGGLTRSTATGTSNGKAMALSGDDAITIRKIWDMGTEVVVMQTVVQLDGDVVTRLNKSFTRAKDQPVRDLHQANVGNALDHWRHLVDTFATITTKALGYLTG